MFLEKGHCFSTQNYVNYSAAKSHGTNSSHWIFFIIIIGGNSDKLLMKWKLCRYLYNGCQLTHIDYAFSASTSVFFSQTKLENGEKIIFQNEMWDWLQENGYSDFTKNILNTNILPSLSLSLWVSSTAQHEFDERVTTGSRLLSC